MEKLKEASFIFYPLEDFEYGMREFAILDNNGYMLQFGEEPAIKYFFSQLINA